MTLIVLTVAVIGLLIAVLAIYLFVLGGLLSRISDNLDDSWQSVRAITGQAQVIGPGVTRLNKTAGDLLGAMPLLIDGADGVAAKLVPSAPPAPSAPAHSTVGVGYMDA